MYRSALSEKRKRLTIPGHSHMEERLALPLSWLGTLQLLSPDGITWPPMDFATLSISESSEVEL